MKEVVISIIIPVYNVEYCLHDCIDSIRNQTYKLLEIILVNDGSTDRCGEICDDYAKCDSRIKVIHKKNGGLSDARNLGIENSSGEYISFIDSDDVVHIKFIEILYQNLLSQNALISCCNFQTFTINSEINYDLSKGKVEIFTGDEFLANLYDSNWIPQNVVVWNKIYHKSVFKELRFPFGKFHEDEFVFHEIYSGQNIIIYSQLELYFYRKRQSSIMQNITLKNYLDIKNAHLKRINFGKINCNEKFVKNTRMNLMKISVKAFYNTSFSKIVKQDISEYPFLFLQYLFNAKHFNSKEIIFLLFKLLK